MRKMRNARVLAVVVCVMAIVSIASADIVQDTDFVPIGNAGNSGDTRAEANPTGCGAVSYDYRIGKYEITNSQWKAFTDVAGAPTGNYGGYSESAYWTDDQQPTNFVSWYEAAQFCNYLTSGDKSLGAYQLGIDGSIAIDRASAISAYGTVYVIPTEDEWYKAAYYKPDGSGYSLYANGLNTIPAADNGWNYYGGSYGPPWDVGTGAQEQNGTFDMMGNVCEWNETLIDGSYRGIRGWSYDSGGADPTGYYLSSSGRSDCLRDPAFENDSVGFRIAEIPEPATLLLFGLGGLAMLRKRRT
jgi:formylglycine-generating enzyme required for sulfatase activity